MTPTCKELIEFLDDYVAGELPSDRAAGFKWHLSRCPSCVAYLASYRETIRIAQHAMAIEIEDVPAGLLTVILATVTTK